MCAICARIFPRSQFYAPIAFRMRNYGSLRLTLAPVTFAVPTMFRTFLPLCCTMQHWQEPRSPKNSQPSQSTSTPRRAHSLFCPAVSAHLLLYSLVNVAEDSRPRALAGGRGTGPADSSGDPGSRLHSQGYAPQCVCWRQAATAGFVYGSWTHDRGIVAR